jgi:hypothetical protein
MLLIKPLSSAIPARADTNDFATEKTGTMVDLLNPSKYLSVKIVSFLIMINATVWLDSNEKSGFKLPPT